MTNDKARARYDDKLDKQILQEMGFPSDAELKEFLKKLDQLTLTEKKLLRVNMPSCSDAVKTFTFPVTEAQLREFIEKRARPGVSGEEGIGSEAQLREFIEKREPGHAAFVTCMNGTVKSKVGKRST
jgi:hypothetical protein